MFASVLLALLKAAGAEDRAWSTQFGFKSGCGTADAVFLARRIIDKVWDTHDGCALLLALDW